MLYHAGPVLWTLTALALSPQAQQGEHPFVEPDVAVIHEVRGEAAGDQFGWIARTLGDVDADGVNDFVTSAPTKALAERNAGRVYVYSGATGEELWRRSGEPGSLLGMGVAAAGDVNGDGVPDVACGAPGAGLALVLSGDDGSTLHELTPPEAAGRFGWRSIGVGDVDGDGRGDVLVSAPHAKVEDVGERAGRVYLFSGSDGGVMRVFDGEAAEDNFGTVLGGGLIGGAPHAVIGGMNAGPGDRGAVYVFNASTGERRFRFEAHETGVHYGRMFVSLPGDLNADGVMDIYSTDWNDAARGDDTGRVYLHSGADGRLLWTRVGENAGDGFGIGPADAGDVNGDGAPDLIIGAWQNADGATSGGKAYLFSGRDRALLRTITCAAENDTFGFDATGLGDVDGDGVDDLLITAAWSEVSGARSGRIFVISGAPAGGEDD